MQDAAVWAVWSEGSECAWDACLSWHSALLRWMSKGDTGAVRRLSSSPGVPLLLLQRQDQGLPVRDGVLPGWRADTHPHKDRAGRLIRCECQPDCWRGWAARAAACLAVFGDGCATSVLGQQFYLQPMAIILRILNTFRLITCVYQRSF